MICKLASGFECEIQDDTLDNMELLDALTALDGGELTSISTIVGMIFAPEQKKALYDHLRNEKGRVPVTAVAYAIKEIFENGAKGKNS